MKGERPNYIDQNGIIDAEAWLKANPDSPLNQPVYSPNQTSLQTPLEAPITGSNTASDEDSTQAILAALQQENKALKAQLRKANDEAQNYKLTLDQTKAELDQIFNSPDTDDPEKVYLVQQNEKLKEQVRSVAKKGLFNRLGIQDQVDPEFGSLYDYFESRLGGSVDFDNEGNVLFVRDGSEEAFISRFKSSRFNQELFFGQSQSSDSKSNPRQPYQVQQQNPSDIRNYMKNGVLDAREYMQATGIDLVEKEGRHNKEGRTKSLPQRNFQAPVITSDGPQESEPTKQNPQKIPYSSLMEPYASYDLDSIIKGTTQIDFQA